MMRFRSTGRPRPVAGWLSRLSLAVFVLFLVACAPRPLPGTLVDGLESPEFNLIDAATGQKVTRADLAGKPTVVTFLYVNCPDVCPLIASKLKQTADELDKEKRAYNIVAITVDPTGDTPEAIKKFSDTRGMTGRWKYLIGSPLDLRLVWAGYAIGVNPLGQIGAHTDALWILDKTTNRRVLLRSDFEPSDLAEHVRRLS